MVGAANTSQYTVLIQRHQTIQLISAECDCSESGFMINVHHKMTQA